MTALNHAVNFTMGASISFGVLTLLNLLVLFARVKWFNKPTYTAQHLIDKSLSWCIFWGKWTVLSIVIFVVLYGIQVN